MAVQFYIYSHTHTYAFPFTTCLLLILVQCPFFEHNSNKIIYIYKRAAPSLHITLCDLDLYLDLYLWQQEVQQDLQELLDLDLCQQEVQEHQDLSLHLFLQVAQQDQ